MVLSFQLWWDNVSIHNVGLTRADKTLLDHLIMRLLSIEFSLLHYNIIGGLILFLEADSWPRHQLVDALCENINIARCVAFDSLNEALISYRIKEFFDVFDFNLDSGGLSVCNFLQVGHVFEFSVNWVFHDFSK